ncbi:MAG: methyltransferase domain-containing protein [Gammaproteobacteria bacterium]|nr:methyltransferase domain-containing protein [Gammaproteobacteria bacterium]
MSVRDPHRFSHELDDATTERLINRLESRANDVVFTRLFDQYANQIDFPESGRTLEIGCGTGAMIRSLVRKNNFSGEVVGVDQSAAFIEAAKGFAAEEGADEYIEFQVCDVHELDFEDDSFDVAIAHTLISHVTDPELVVKELARVLRKEGTLVIFDGDYASLTYALPDHELGRRMDHALATASFNNPLIMRDLIRMLPGVGLQVTNTLADVVSEVGSCSYFRSFAETYAPFVVSAGLMSEQEVEGWFSMLEQSIKDNTFFASCNYYTYIIKST